MDFWRWRPSSEKCISGFDIHKGIRLEMWKCDADNYAMKMSKSKPEVEF